MTTQGPSDWITETSVPITVQDAGVPLPVQPNINIIGAESVSNNPGNNSIDIVVIPSSRAPRNYVPLSNANASPGSPYAPQPGDWCFVDLTSGPVEIAPAGLSTSQWFYFKIKPGVTPTGTNSLTVTAMAGGQIEQPVFGTFGSSLVFSDSTVMGASLTLVCVGTNLVIE